MNIFIASLPFQLEESEIKEIFEDYGEVSSVKLITDRETGKKRGFGFIEMPNEEEALNAIKAMDKTEIYDRTIAVSQAEDRRQGSRNSYQASRNNFSKGGYSKSNYSNGYNRSGNRSY
ncbi:MAG TPA: RNA-binding protein [Sphingobacteriaceae bacterium]